MWMPSSVPLPALAQDIDCLLHRRRAFQIAALRGSYDTSRAVMAVSGGNSQALARPGETVPSKETIASGA